MTSTESGWIQVASLAFTGGLIGSLLGELWRPPGPRAGLAGGAVAGALFQVAVIATAWNTSKPPSTVALAMALSAAAIAGSAIALLSRPRP